MTKKKTQRWSAEVNRTSDSLDLEKGVFTANDPKAIAESLKRSAEASTRRRTSPFRSAMSMLNFYINRAGKHLDKRRRAKLEKSKEELRKLFGRDGAKA